jgi:predicted ATPase
VKVKKFHISNYKSILDLSINQPSPFSVFVGPNGSGKSNIFEAIEFFYFLQRFRVNNVKNDNEIIQLFGGKAIVPKQQSATHTFKFTAENNSSDFTCEIKFEPEDTVSMVMEDEPDYYPRSKNFFSAEFENFTRVFIGKKGFNKINLQGNQYLNAETSNVENVLSRLFQNATIKEEITDWLQLFVPELQRIEIKKTELSDSPEIAFFEKTLREPLTKALISDGTFNILALLTAVYQSDKPQFLLIEEPENGLHPYVIKELMKFFRQQCEEKGHYIWLNTHSQALVDELKPDEIILVDKKEGATQIKQFSREQNLHGLKMDFAWLSNALGGGVPW